MNKKKFFSKGFTLVEVIVVIFIISVLTGVLVSNFSGISRQLALKRAAYQLAQDLRNAQERAISMSQTSVTTLPYKLADWHGAPPPPPSNVATGYGILFSLNPSDSAYASSTKYLLYSDSTADTNGETALDCTPGRSPLCWDSFNYADIQGSVFGSVVITIQEPNVVIKNIGGTNLANASCATSRLSINFTPPNPITTIWCLDPQAYSADNSGNYYTAEITLGLSDDPTQTKKVIVNKTGLIYVE